MSFISEAYAQVTQTAPASGENPLMNLLPLILIFAVFYLFLIRPQQKKIREHEALLNTMKRGDEVVTGGGIVGKVSKIEEGSNIVHVEIAPDVIVRVNKATIIEILANGVTEKKAPKAEKKAPAAQPEKKEKKSKASA
jgi:preprotein translocase subunit YajC